MARIKPKIRIKNKIKNQLELTDPRLKTELNKKNTNELLEDLEAKTELDKDLLPEERVLVYEPELEPVEYIPPLFNIDESTIPLSENSEQYVPLTTREELIEFIKDGAFTPDNILEGEAELDFTAKELAEFEYYNPDEIGKQIGVNENGEPIYRVIQEGKYDSANREITIGSEAPLFSIIEEASHGTIHSIRDREPEFGQELRDWGERLDPNKELPYSGEELFVKSYLANRLTYLEEFPELANVLKMDDSLIIKMDSYLGTGKDGVNRINKIFNPYKTKKIFTVDQIMQNARQDKRDTEEFAKTTKKGRWEEDVDVYDGVAYPRNIAGPDKGRWFRTTKKTKKIPASDIISIKSADSYPKGIQQPDKGKTQKGVLFHVTPTKNIPMIKKEGLTTDSKRTPLWNKSRGGQYGEGEIYAFENLNDALGWAQKMQFDLGIPLSETSIIKISKQPRAKTSLTPDKLKKAIDSNNYKDMVKYSLAKARTNTLKIEEKIKSMSDKIEFNQLKGELRNAKGIPKWQIDHLYLDSWGKKKGDIITKEELVARLDKFNINPKTVIRQKDSPNINFNIRDLFLKPYLRTSTNEALEDIIDASYLNEHLGKEWATKIKENYVLNLEHIFGKNYQSYINSDIGIELAQLSAGGKEKLAMDLIDLLQFVDDDAFLFHQPQYKDYSLGHKTNAIENVSKKKPVFKIINKSYHEDIIEVGKSSPQLRVEAISQDPRNTLDMRAKFNQDVSKYSLKYNHGHFGSMYFAHLRAQRLTAINEGKTSVYNIDEIQGDWGHEFVDSRKKIITELSYMRKDLFGESLEEASRLIRKMYTRENIEKLNILLRADLPLSEFEMTKKFGVEATKAFNEVYGPVDERLILEDMAYRKTHDALKQDLETLLVEHKSLNAQIDGERIKAVDFVPYSYNALVEGAKLTESDLENYKPDYVISQAQMGSSLRGNITIENILDNFIEYPLHDLRMVFRIPTNHPFNKTSPKNIEKLSDSDISKFPKKHQKYTRRTIGDPNDKDKIEVKSSVVWYEIKIDPNFLFHQKAKELLSKTWTPETPYSGINSWAEVALQQAVRNAVEKGDDFITWSPGAVQSNRYTNIEEMVSQIIIRPQNLLQTHKYFKLYNRGAGGRYRSKRLVFDVMFMDKEGKPITDHRFDRYMDEETLAKHVGTSIVNRLIKNQDLKVADKKDIEKLVKAKTYSPKQARETVYSFDSKDIASSKNFMEMIYGNGTPRSGKDKSVLQKLTKKMYGVDTKKIIVGSESVKEMPYNVKSLGEHLILNVQEQGGIHSSEPLNHQVLKEAPLCINNRITSSESLLTSADGPEVLENISLNKMFHQSDAYERIWWKIEDFIKKNRKQLASNELTKKLVPHKSLTTEFSSEVDRKYFEEMIENRETYRGINEDLLSSLLGINKKVSIRDIMSIENNFGTKTPNSNQSYDEYLGVVEESNVTPGFQLYQKEARKLIQEYNKALWKWADIDVKTSNSKYVDFQTKTEKRFEMYENKFYAKNPKEGKPIYFEGFKIPDKVKANAHEVKYSFRKRNPKKPNVSPEFMPMKKMAKKLNAFNSFIQKYFQTSLYRIRKISPEVAVILTQHDGKLLMTTQDRTEKVAPFRKWLGTMRAKEPARYVEIDVALKNGQFDFVLDEARKDGVEQEFFKTIAVQEQIGKELVETGVLHPSSLMENYYPRQVADLENLRLAIGSDKAALIDKALATAEKTKGRPLSEYEKSDVINNVLAGYGNYVEGGVRWNKARTIEELPPELNQFYLGSEDALLNYVVGATTHIMERRFFGNGSHIDEDGKSNKIYDGDSVGEYIQNLIETNTISSEDQKLLRELLTFRFSPTPFSNMTQSYKNIIYSFTLGGLDSGLSQLQDLGLSLYFEKGNLGLRAIPPILRAMARNTIKYITFGKVNPTLGKRDIDRGKLGVDKIWFEQDNMQSFTAKALQNVFRLNTMDAADGIGKDSHVNTILGKLRRQARKYLSTGEMPFDLKKWLSRGFIEKDWEKVIKELDSGEITDDVKLLAFSILMNIHPVTKSNVALGYDKHPFLYQLRTFAINQLNFLSQEFKDVWNESRKAKGFLKKSRLKAKAVNDLGWQVALLVLAGASVQSIRDWINGRETRFSDHAVSTMLRMLFISRYHFWKFKEQIEIAGEKRKFGKKEENLANIVIDSVLPAAFTIPGIIALDGVRVVKYAWEEEEDELGDKILRPNLFQRLDAVYYIPFIGHQAYWWYGKGEIKEHSKRYFRIKDEIKTIREEKNLKRKDGVQDFLAVEDATAFVEHMLYLKSLGELTDNQFKNSLGDLLGEADPYYLEVKKELDIQNKKKKIKKTKKEIEEGTYDPPMRKKKKKKRKRRKVK